MLKHIRLLEWLFCGVLLSGAVMAANTSAAPAPEKNRLETLQTRIDALRPDPAYPDDPYVLETLKEACAALSAKSGGIGACLVDERTGAIIERGRNRQYTGYFRSDLHAEMDLLDRYEERARKPLASAGGNPRECSGLVLYSSVEPCPMCLTRIINSGLKKVYYVAPDPEGGMVTRMHDLPPFWRQFAAGRTFLPARCAPEMRAIAEELFNYSIRNFKRQ